MGVHRFDKEHPGCSHVVARLHLHGATRQFSTERAGPRIAVQDDHSFWFDRNHRNRGYLRVSTDAVTRLEVLVLGKDAVRLVDVAAEEGTPANRSCKSRRGPVLTGQAKATPGKWERGW